MASEFECGDFTPIESGQPPAVVQLRRDSDGRRAIWPLTNDLNPAVLRLAYLSPVGTSSWVSPLPTTAMASAGTPWRTISFFTAFARRSDRAIL